MWYVSRIEVRLLFLMDGISHLWFSWLSASAVEPQSWEEGGCSGWWSWLSSGWGAWSKGTARWAALSWEVSARCLWCAVQGSEKRCSSIPLRRRRNFWLRVGVRASCLLYFWLKMLIMELPLCLAWGWWGKGSWLKCQRCSLFLSRFNRYSWIIKKIVL